MSRTVDLTGQRICVVDDDVTVLEAIRMTLEQVGAETRCFSEGPACLQALGSGRCDLLIADVKMPGISGLELLREVERVVPCLPVLLVTGYGDVPMAVDAMKAGAADFMEKPLEMNSFLTTVESAISGSRGAPRRADEVLTRVELEVLRSLLAGKTTREIAKLRHRAVRTIEDERARIMRKLGARSVAELLKLVANVRLPDVLQES